MTAKKPSYADSVRILDRKEGSKNATLSVTNGCFAGLNISIKKNKTSLGSDLRCDICLDDPIASKEHAMILKTKEGYYIEDLRSREGTAVNGKEINRKKLRSGDIIEIGNFRLRFSCTKAKQKH